MKKNYILIIFMILLFCGCQKQNTTEDIENNNAILQNEEASETTEVTEAETENTTTEIETTDVNEDEIVASEAKELLFGKWEIIDVYAIRPSAFGFNSIESFQKYKSYKNDPYTQQIISLYSDRFGKQVEFSEDNIIIDNEIIDKPNYSFKKYEGQLYSNNDQWWNYRPFDDYFKDYQYDHYYHFDTDSAYEYNTDEGKRIDLAVFPSGYIISKDYIVCPLYNDWIFFVLKRL